jgi:UDP-N-acetylglucosamine transferase subunit ALG13
MIFVTVGTSTQPFDRLVEGVPPLAATEEVVVQYGASAIRPAGAECVAFLEYAEMLDHMRDARAVVTHAGVGSIMAALSVGKRPFVVPRRRDLGEAVDDHQLELATRLEKAGLVTLVADPAALPDALAASQPAPPGENGRPNALVEDLRAYLENAGRR